MNPALWLYAGYAAGTLLKDTRRYEADLSVELEHDRQHIKDSENCDAEPRKLEVLQKYVTLKGDLSAQERQRLLEIADRCPVHQTLHGDLAIRTELKD